MSKHELAKIQAWMQRVIMHPGGVQAGIEADEAREQIDVAPEAVEQVIAPSSRQTSVERLAVYANAYQARLLECLRAEYPITLKAMGEELFDQFAIGYLERYPSQSYTLDHLGAQFATYLAETRPADDDADWAWLDFLVDLARLEWNIAEVFDGPGAEREPPLDTSQLLAIGRERWPEARLVAVPCLRVIRLDFPVHEYYRALRKADEATPPERGETWLAITRRNYVVRHLPLMPLEAALLDSILGGATVGDALDRMELPADLDPQAFAGTLRGWFERWSAEGFFLRVELPQ